MFDLSSLFNGLAISPLTIIDANVKITIEPPAPGSLLPKAKIVTTEKVLGVDAPGLNDEIDPAHALMMIGLGVSGLFKNLFGPKGAPAAPAAPKK